MIKTILTIPDERLRQKSDEIISFDKSLKSLVANLNGHVIRPAEIDLEAQDKQGKKVKGHFTGLPARIIQHEIDHLNGILFIYHVHNQNGKIFEVSKDKKGKDQLVEVTIA